MMDRILLTIAVFGLAQASGFAGEPFAPLEQEALAILKAEFPGAEFGWDEHIAYIRTFAANERRFTIYRPNKVGEWQDPMEVQAPDRRGILVRFYVREGKWGGALGVPHNGTRDLYVFKETHVVRNSQDGKWHVWAEIRTPRFDSPEETKRELVSLFNRFGQYQH